MVKKKIKNIKLAALIFFFGFANLSSAQEKLEVSGNLSVQSPASGSARYGVILKPQTSSPATPQEGQIYYNDTSNVFYYRDNTSWKLLGADKYEIAKIVAASNSLETSCQASVCINPRADYTCDGTNDEVEIQAAINALGDNGGTIYLIEGTYYISASIVLDETSPYDSGKAIVGQGRSTVLKLVGTPSSLNLINISARNNSVSHLTLDGNNSGTNITGIYSSGVETKIDSVWAENFKGQGIWVTGGEHIITKNYLKNNSSTGVICGGSYTIIADNYVENTASTGISVGAGNVVVSNNQLVNNYNGIYLSSNEITVTGNNIQGSLGYGISVKTDFAAHNVISANNIQGSQIAGIILREGPDSAGYNTVSNNIIQGSADQGINVRGSSNNNITGNIIYESGGTGTGEGKSGIQLSQYLTYYNRNNLIASNRIYDSLPATGGAYGITLSGNQSDANYIVSNLIDGAAYTTGTGRQIQDLGINTKYTDKLKVTLERIAIPFSGGTLGTVITSPRTYVAFTLLSDVSMDGTTAIDNGKAVGDILILENESSFTLSVPNNANTILNASPRQLHLDDVLTLLWNGNDWIEIGWADNTPP